MKKTILILFALLLAACAAKEPPFDAAVALNNAEKSMQREHFEEARKAYQEIQEKSPDRTYDAAIMLRIADSYFGEEKYEEALLEYRSFLNYHPVHKEALYAQFRIAMCNFKQLTTIDRDPSPTRTAMKEFQKLLDTYPDSTYQETAGKNISICLDRLAQYELYVGNFYYRKKAYRAAAGRFENLLREFPGSSAEKEALYHSGLSYMELNEKARALDTFETLLKKYPSMATEVRPLIEKLSTP